MPDQNQYRMHPTECGLTLAIHPAMQGLMLSLDGYQCHKRDLKFLVTAGREADNRVWVHASVSRRDRKMPTFEDLKELKKYTMPLTAIAYQVFVPESEWVSEVHPGQAPVLHLWSCPGWRPTPDFRGEWHGRPSI